ncbi:MAG: nodulation protein NfeD [candidate division WOR-3 bacterium]
MIILWFILVTAEIYKLKIDSPITPPVAEYITQGIERANSQNAKLVIITIDTPGGLDESMRNINKAILASKIPVVAYVYPSGARAASAGAFIAMACHVLAMAPGTSIGACHPVAIGTQMDSVMVKKTANDAAAYLKSLAEIRGRNTKWAEEAVFEAKSSSSEEAKALRVADLIVKTEDELLDSLTGRLVKIDKERVCTLSLEKPYKIHEVRMGFREKLLTILSNPNIAYILLVLGFYGLLFELSNPGSIFPGVAGVICIILAFYALQTLPVNYAGLALMFVSIAFFILEIFIQPSGILATGGVISFILGSLLLFKGGHMFRVSKTLVLSAALLTALFFFWVVRAGIKTFFLRPKTGSEGLIGEKGIAKTKIDRKGGTCFVHGELWNARSETPIEAGEEVKIIKVEGLTIWVEKCENS